MFIDMLGTNNMVCFNRIIAGKLGLHPAIYLNELLRKCSSSIQAKKLIEDKYFILDRGDIFSRTTLTEQEQLSIDLLLIDLKIIEKRKSQIDGLSDEIFLDLDALVALFTDKTIIKTTKVLSETKTKQRGAISQREQHKQELKKNTTTLIKEKYKEKEVVQAYLSWIDGVYLNPKGFLSMKAINLFQETLSNYVKNDLKLLLAILDVATANGYRDATWAINAFEENYRKFYNEEQNQDKSRITDKAKVLSSEEF